MVKSLLNLTNINNYSLLLFFRKTARIINLIVVSFRPSSFQKFIQKLCLKWCIYYNYNINLNLHYKTEIVEIT